MFIELEPKMNRDERLNFAIAIFLAVNKISRMTKQTNNIFILKERYLQHCPITPTSHSSSCIMYLGGIWFDLNKNKDVNGHACWCNCNPLSQVLYLCSFYNPRTIIASLRDYDNITSSKREARSAH